MNEFQSVVGIAYDLYEFVKELMRSVCFADCMLDWGHREVQGTLQVQY